MRIPRFFVLFTLLHLVGALPADAREYLVPGGDVSRLVFGKIELKGRDLHGIRAVGTSFRGADLRGVDFRDANLRRARLEHSDLRGADLRTQRKFMRGARLEGARFDEFTQLPENWGDTHARRIESAILSGMRFEPTVGSLDSALKLLDSRVSDCEASSTPKPGWALAARDIPSGDIPLASPGVSGRWNGEINGMAGTLEIRRLTGTRFLGRFESRETGEIFTLSIWLETVNAEGAAPFTNRAFVEWRSSFGALGRGWILISSDRGALTGQLGMDRHVNGIDLTFFR